MKTKELILFIVFVIILSLLVNSWLRFYPYIFSKPKNETEATLSAEPASYYILRVKVTAYSSDPAQTDSTPDIPAFAKKVSPDGCAVSRPLSLLAPPGSLVFIGAKNGRDVEVRVVNDLLNTAEDKSGSILAIDLWMPTLQEAKEVGSSWQTIVVVPNIRHYKGGRK